MSGLAETLAALDSPDGWFTHVAGAPSGDGWVRVADMSLTPPEGWFDGLAVLGTALRVVPEEELATLREVVAPELVGLLMPIFETVRRWAPHGTAGMWGSLADGIAADALAAAMSGAS